jgi:hypothetical protein
MILDDASSCGSGVSQELRSSSEVKSQNPKSKSVEGRQVERIKDGRNDHTAGGFDFH